MNVRRTLPQRRPQPDRRVVLPRPLRPGRRGGTAAWRSRGTRTPAWRRSAGSSAARSSTGTPPGPHAIVRPGELNLMTAGAASATRSSPRPGRDVLHGAQLWVALPDATAARRATFEHHRPTPVVGDGLGAAGLPRVAAGQHVARAHAHPAAWAQSCDLEAGAQLRLALDPRFEHGVLVDAGDADARRSRRSRWTISPTCRPAAIDLVLRPESGPVRALLIGGEPLGEQIVMWWNFVGRSHEEIVAYRAPGGGDRRRAPDAARRPGVGEHTLGARRRGAPPEVRHLRGRSARPAPGAPAPRHAHAPPRLKRGHRPELDHGPARAGRPALRAPATARP